MLVEKQPKNLVVEAPEEERKMSLIIKEMAVTLLKNPNKPPTSEAAHAALLFANVAWNRAVGDGFSDFKCKRILKNFEQSRRSLWVELRSRDWRMLVKELIEYKMKHYPNDKRIIAICGMRDGNVRVEWEYPDTDSLSKVTRNK